MIANIRLIEIFIGDQPICIVYMYCLNIPDIWADSLVTVFIRL